MNRTKQALALLLAIVLVLGIAIQPGVGGVFGKDAEPDQETTESTSESVENSTEESMPEVTAESTATPETTAESTQELTTEPTAESMLESTDESALEPTTEMTEEPMEPAEESAEYAWAALTDVELAAWLMDEANAETVKAILQSEGEEYDALMARINAILSGDDEELAMNLQKYLSKLTGLDEAETLAGSEYIYLDLAAANITIGPDGYSGAVYVGGVCTGVSGRHEDTNKYYIYQSTTENKNFTGFVTSGDQTSNNCVIPSYTPVKHEGKLWAEYITDNINVKKVSENWDTAATKSDRTSTDHCINFAPASNYTADVTIDNIWTTYKEESTEWRTSGGIGVNLSHTDYIHENTHIYIRMKGDNRVGRVHYSAYNGKGNTIEFFDGETTAPSGSITVADFKDNWKGNHWCAAIGGADNPMGYGDKSDGIVIHGGVIYAGTTPEDNCTAIGGGGNDYGSVTIRGGTVTAVVSSTGTAIGGGIGYSDPGGNTDILITDGTVYAYNLGITPESDPFGRFVPAAAIGGGGSNKSDANTHTVVTIEGGTVYAQSTGGPAIGGGGSASAKGGHAVINISGGDITAKSIPGKYGETPITEGVSIGGGTGFTSGGSVELNITGGTIRTASIGGGTGTEKETIGSAKVTIGGGDITGQVIMAATGVEGEECSFTMTDGLLHGSDVTQVVDKFYYLREDGGAVWMQDSNGVANISGGTISGCTAYRGGAVYMEGGIFNLSGNGKIENNTAIVQNPSDAGTTGRGGGVYVTGGTANIEGGTVSGNKAQARGGGVYVTKGSIEGKVNVSGGSIQGNTAGFATDTVTLPADAGRGGGVYLEGGLFTMIGGKISGNHANYRGGGIFLTSSPKLTGGVISDNKATDSGGGLCVNGASVTLEEPAMQIYGNNASKGGGVAVLNGDFTLNGGAVGVENGITAGNANKATKGGGVYVQAENEETAANAKVLSGNVWYNSAVDGGGVYLANGKGTFTLEGVNAVISYNTATDGGGVYLYKDPKLNHGRIANNTATANGGGMYIADCEVNLNPTQDVYITKNQAAKGAGIYIHRLTGTGVTTDPPAVTVDAVTGATQEPDHRVGLHILNGQGIVHFTKNVATESGGAVCVDLGYFVLETDQVDITENHAVNGGGVAVLKGNFTMTGGAVGESGKANTATNGGGVYVSEGQVWLRGGSVEYNEAESGGGAYVTGGDFNMFSGSLKNNVAAENGGGAYVAGEFRMVDGTIGGDGGSNTAKNGGGVYVSDGNVTIVSGQITHNEATEDGGGFYVSASAAASAGSETIDVVMLSGSLSNNQAGVNGGGMAVDSSSGKTILVEIGCMLNHNVTAGSPTYPVAYTGATYEKYGNYYEQRCEHGSCPLVENNSAGAIGGGFYMNSDASTLKFYCVEETNNKAQGASTAGMDVVGGTVVIGDEYYHNHEHDGKLADPHRVPWGYIAMDDATLVNGGTVDIYGDMTNPVFKNEVTVDIEDKNTDHFFDHRRDEKNTRFKVHYFENFGEGGLYQAIQYNEGETTIDVQGALYSHPGYRILGWCTKPVYDKNDTTCHYYQVGTTIDLTGANGMVHGMGETKAECTECGDQFDKNLLVLYAIWEVNGFTVVFDPNVPEGKTYTGEMADQIFEYGNGEPLIANAYKYPGNFFKNWNTKPDGSGTAYVDGADGSKLTKENGVKVVLYAQWDPCDHKDPSRWTYEVKPDAHETLWRICSCGGQTLTATLFAEDTVYDGHDHPAELTLSDAAAWGNDKPTVVYTSKWLSDGLNHSDTTGPELSEEGKPFHAGMYQASITKQNTVNDAKVDVKAYVDYTIEKAEQLPPEKPTYDLSNDKTKVAIQKLAEDTRPFTDAAGRPHTAKAEYCLISSSETKWGRFPDNDSTPLELTMDTALTTYTVGARYSELDDYKASDIKKADTTYFFAGNVIVKIICDDGIDCEDVVANGNDLSTDGVSLTLKTDPNYYLVGGKYNVKAQIQENYPPADPGPATDTAVTENSANQYSVTSIPNNSILTITIGDAKKAPQVTAQVMPGQKFSAFTGGDTTSISRDSAFTASYRIGNFDPAAYECPKLTFGAAIPQGTTLILLDRGAGTYWYYRATSEVSSIALTSFTKMGESGTPFPAPTVATGNVYVDLRYQLIVDFSQSAAGCPGDLTMTLEAGVKDAKTNAPKVKPDVKVKMADSNFSFTNTPGTDGLTNSFTCSFTKGGEAASKWENRSSALVLTPVLDTELPADAQIKAEVDGGITWLYRTGNFFIVPLSLLKDTSDVKLTLKSDLFSAANTSYTFNAQWLISPSRAGKAPVTGDQVGTAEVTFTFKPEKQPSLKPEESDRVLTSEQTLKLQIDTRGMTDYTVSASLLRKSDDGTAFIETGWNEDNVESNLNVSLAGQQPGSFCLMLTVKKENDITVVMEVPYHFVIKAAE